MNNSDDLIIKIYGKKAELSVYESRVVLHKGYWRYYHSAWYSEVKNILYREPSQKQTGFIKLHTTKVIFEFVIRKTKKRDSDEQVQDVKDNMRIALAQIEKRVMYARNLPENTSIVTYLNTKKTRIGLS